MLGACRANQGWATGAASSMCPMRSRRTAEVVISTPHTSQTKPGVCARLCLPQKHVQSFVGPKMRSENRPSFSGWRVRQSMVSGFVTSP